MNRTPADTYFIVRCVIEQGNKPGLITQWFDGMKAWADANPGPDAQALRLWLGLIRPRPFYTAAELSRFWPALKITLRLTDRLEAQPSPNRLENELIFCGLPVLQAANPEWFFNISRRPYFIVEHCHRWRDARLTQEEFENVLYG